METALWPDCWPIKKKERVKIAFKLGCPDGSKTAVDFVCAFLAQEKRPAATATLGLQNINLYKLDLEEGKSIEDSTVKYKEEPGRKTIILKNGRIEDTTVVEGGETKRKIVLYGFPYTKNDKPHLFWKFALHVQQTSRDCAEWIAWNPTYRGTPVRLERDEEGVIVRAPESYVAYLVSCLWKKYYPGNARAWILNVLDLENIHRTAVAIWDLKKNGNPAEYRSNLNAILDEQGVKLDKLIEHEKKQDDAIEELFDNQQVLEMKLEEHKDRLDEHEERIETLEQEREDEKEDHEQTILQLVLELQNQADTIEDLQEQIRVLTAPFDGEAEAGGSPDGDNEDAKRFVDLQRQVNRLQLKIRVAANLNRKSSASGDNDSSRVGDASSAAPEAEANFMVQHQREQQQGIRTGTKSLGQTNKNNTGTGTGSGLAAEQPQNKVAAAAAGEQQQRDGTEAKTSAIEGRGNSKLKQAHPGQLLPPIKSDAFSIQQPTYGRSAGKESTRGKPPMLSAGEQIPQDQQMGAPQGLITTSKKGPKKNGLPPSSAASAAELGDIASLSISEPQPQGKPQPWTSPADPATQYPQQTSNASFDVQQPAKPRPPTTLEQEKQLQQQNLKVNPVTAPAPIPQQQWPSDTFDKNRNSHQQKPKQPPPSGDGIGGLQLQQPLREHQQQQVPMDFQLMPTATGLQQQQQQQQQQKPPASSSSSATMSFNVGVGGRTRPGRRRNTRAKLATQHESPSLVNHTSSVPSVPLLRDITAMRPAGGKNPFSVAHNSGPGGLDSGTSAGGPTFTDDENHPNSTVGSSGVQKSTIGKASGGRDGPTAAASVLDPAVALSHLEIVRNLDLSSRMQACGEGVDTLTSVVSPFVQLVRSHSTHGMADAEGYEKAWRLVDNLLCRSPSSSSSSSRSGGGVDPAERVTARAAASLAYLCRSFWLKVRERLGRSTQWDESSGANNDRGSATAQACKAFAKLMKPDASPGTQAWATLYYCLRCGDAVAAVEAASWMQSLVIPRLRNLLVAWANAQHNAPCVWGGPGRISSVVLPCLEEADRDFVADIASSLLRGGSSTPYMQGVYSLASAMTQPPFVDGVPGMETIEDDLLFALNKAILPSPGGKSNPVKELAELAKDFGPSHSHLAEDGVYAYTLPLLLTQQYQQALGHLQRHGGDSGLMQASHLALVLTRVAGVPLQDLFESGQRDLQQQNSTIATSSSHQIGSADSAFVASLLSDYANQLLDEPLMINAAAPLEYLVRIPDKSTAAKKVAALIAKKQETKHLVGELTTEGTRQGNPNSAIIDQFFTPEEISSILTDAAEQLRSGASGGGGGTKLQSEAILCYMLAGRYDSAMQLLSKLLSPPKYPDEYRAHWLEHTKRLYRQFIDVDIPTRVLQVLEEQDRRVIHTNRTLVRLNDFFAALGGGRTTEALKFAKPLLPSSQSDPDMKKCEMKKCESRDLDHCVIAAMPEFLLEAFKILHKNHLHLKQQLQDVGGGGGGGDRIREQLSKLQDEVKLLATYARTFDMSDPQAGRLSLMAGSLYLERILTKVEEEELQRALFENGVKDERVYSSGTDTIQRRNFQTLQPDKWLSDEVINLYYALLSNRDEELCKADPTRKRCHFFNSYFMTQLCGGGYENVKKWSSKVPGGNIFQLDKIFFPINITNLHWMCAVAFMQERRIRLYDSNHGRDRRHYLNRILEYLKEEHLIQTGKELPNLQEWKDKLNVDHINTPKQGNDNDCGVFTCMITDFISVGYPLSFDEELTFNQERITKCRVRKLIASAIMTGKATFI